MGGGDANFSLSGALTVSAGDELDRFTDFGQDFLYNPSINISLRADDVTLIVELFGWSWLTLRIHGVSLRKTLNVRAANGLHNATVDTFQVRNKTYPASHSACVGEGHACERVEAEVRVSLYNPSAVGVQGDMGLMSLDMLFDGVPLGVMQVQHRICIYSFTRQVTYVCARPMSSF